MDDIACTSSSSSSGVNQGDIFKLLFEEDQISAVRGHHSVTAILLSDGSVHTFGQEDDILGHSTNTTKVSALDTLIILDVCAGGGHIFATDDSGKVYGWGLNSDGQLGWCAGQNFPVPKLVKPLISNKIVSVACGWSHTLFLTNDGAVFTAGNNQYGQLGRGFSASSAITTVASIIGIPIMRIATGYYHSFAITASGTVFGWGRNDYGQLGLGHTDNKANPTLLKSLRSQNIRYIGAGKYHSIALTSDGGVFSFGSNMYGQCGHGFSTAQSCVTPRKVFELMGSDVCQVACGSYHTLAVVGSQPNLYVFGNNESRQLGYEMKKVNENFVPNVLNGPWNQKSVYWKNRRSVSVKEVAAGGATSFLSISSSNASVNDFRLLSKRQQILTLSDELISKLDRCEDERLSPNIKQYLETVMRSSACLNASFLADDHVSTSSNYHGCNIMAARLSFAKLARCKCNKQVSSVMSQCLQNLIFHLPQSPPDIEALRLYITLPECQLLSCIDYYESLTFPFANKLCSLVPAASKVLDRWFHCLEPIYFCRSIDMYKEAISTVLTKPSIFDRSATSQHLRSALDFLKKLNRVNEMEINSEIIPFQRFYLPDIKRLINLEQDYIHWIQGHTTSKKVVFCNYPFLLNSEAKTSLLQIDANWQMKAAFSAVQQRNMSTMFGLTSSTFLEEPVLELEVRRHEILQDTLSRLVQVDMPSLKKPLVVKFQGEEGQDAGGVRKEYFMLILKEVVDPKYGMFRYFEESHLMWFSDFYLETDSMYCLVGLLCGLAIYNNTIIDICFPTALYKKLLGETVSLSDLSELDPVMFRSMQQLLAFNEQDGTTIEDVFCLAFTVTRDNFGEHVEIELIPDGKNITVTKDNRQQYVDCYIDYLFNKSVEKQFTAFYRGFHKVCGGKILELFRPKELMEMVVGNANYNWEEFEKFAKYKGEFYRQHPVIDMFWSVFHRFTLEEKKTFLLFLTGCDKVPITGVTITLQSVRLDDNYLPVAHTCFNLLDLPLYSSESVLETKLRKAIENNMGFYLV